MRLLANTDLNVPKGVGTYTYNALVYTLKVNASGHETSTLGRTI